MTVKKNIGLILHLTHTDLRVDWKIRKELGALSEAFAGPSLRLLGVGIDDGSAWESKYSEKYKIFNFKARIPGGNLFPKSLKYIFTLIQFYFFVLWKFGNRTITVIHAHDAPVLPVAAILAQLNRIPLIYDAHEFGPDKNGQSLLFKALTDIFERISWPRVSEFVTVSHEIAVEYVRRYGVKPYVLHHNVPAVASVNIDSKGQSRKPTPSIRQRLGISAEEKLFIYSGLLVPGRGIEMLLAAFSRIKEAHVVFMGFGELDKLIDNAGRQRANIHRHPHVPNDVVCDYLAQADFGLCVIERVSLSDYLALPNKLFEYIFAKIPVVGSNFPAIARVINEFDAGIVVDMSEAELERVIKQALNSKKDDYYKRTPATDYSWEGQKNSLVGLYTRLRVVSRPSF